MGYSRQQQRTSKPLDLKKFGAATRTAITKGCSVGTDRLKSADQPTNKDESFTCDSTLHRTGNTPCRPESSRGYWKHSAWITRTERATKKRKRGKKR